MRVGVFLRTFAAAILLSGGLILLCSSAAGEEISPRDKIYSSLLAAEPEIGVSEFGLDKTELIKLLREILLDAPELFYVSGKVSYSHGANGRVLTLTPTYTATGDELDTQRKFYTDTVTGLLSALRESAGEAERALYIHDTLAAKFDYDVNYENYDAYSLFANGRGVCQAYSLAFIALARTVGLEARMITSDEMDHAWNILRIDGEWYHIDVTRDDPISDIAPSETVLHQVFLRSDGAMKALGYYGYQSPYTCDSGRFESEGKGLLENVTTAVIFSEYGCFATAKDGRKYRVELAKTPALTVLPSGDLDGNGVADAHDLQMAAGTPDFEEIRSIILSEMMKEVYLEEILRIRESRK